jgi:hypothetical protein
MTQYTILVNKNTGVPVVDRVLMDNQPLPTTLPEFIIPVVFDAQTTNFELLKAFFVLDPDRLVIDYKPAMEGGVLYNADTGTFSFHKMDLSINVEAVKNFRNELLRQSDMYMLIPDLPQDIKQELLAYRQALRDSTNKINVEWKTVRDIQWPEFPRKLIMTPIQPPNAVE